MALATQTASMANANIPIRANEKGLQTVNFYYNSGTTAISATAATILLCKIPNGATVLDYLVHHSTGAATCPADYGYSVLNSAGTASASLSMFGTQQAKATVNRSNKIAANVAYTAGVPFKISLSDDVNQPRIAYFTGTFANSSASASLIVQGYVTYTMDGIIPGA
jgi:hypothetical protein